MTSIHSIGTKPSGYDLVMLTYLITGAAVLPVLVGEALVEYGLIAAMSEKSMPPWMYAYVVFVTFSGAFALFVAWVPAIVVCLKFRKHWRAVVPAAAVLVCTGAVFLMESSKTIEYAAATAAAVYVLTAFGVGLEWLIQQMR